MNAIVSQRQEFEDNLQHESAPEPPISALVAPVDAVYATAVLSITRSIAVFYWARSRGHNRPLILLDFTVGPFAPDTWWSIGETLGRFHVERRARYHTPLGLWIEGEALAAQAFIGGGLDARMIPEYLTKDAIWHSMCQSVAAMLATDQLAMIEQAKASLDRRPFLNAAGVYAGPRTDDPTVAAFMYGIILGLDVVLSKDPHRKPPVKSAR